MLDLEEERKRGRMEIDQMLKDFETDKWVTIMGTIGGSLREKSTRVVCMVLQRLGLVELESNTIYELTDAGFRMLSNEEKRRLEGGKGKSRRKRKKNGRN